jgi:REP element-mobilizing transposase RayT
MFHVTTNTSEHIPWCTLRNIPRIVIDNLSMTRNVYGAHLYAFCILPDHIHVILSPGERGITRFMQSFKSNTTKDVLKSLRLNKDILRSLGRGVPAPEKIIARIRLHNGFHEERIRDSYQCSAAMAYVQGNAVNHALAKEFTDWPWSSLRFPELTDVIEPWLD